MLRIYLVSVFFLTLNINSLAATGVNNFFSKPDIISARLSPDGRYTVTINSIDNDQHLNLISNKTLVRKTIFHVSHFTKKEATIRHTAWIDNRHIAVQFFETRKGVKDLLDTKNVQHLLIIRLPDTTQKAIQVLSVRTKGWLVNPLPQEDNVFLYAKGGPYSKVYRLNTQQLTAHKAKANKLMKIDGGQFIKSNEVASVKGYATRWFINNNGKPVASLHYIKDGDLQLSALDEKGNTRALKVWKKQTLNGEGESGQLANKILIPVARANEDNSFYCLDFSEDEERSVYKVNFSSMQETLVFEADSYKIIDLIITDNGDLMGATVIKDADIQHIYLDHYTDKTGATEATGHKKSVRNHTLETVINTSSDHAFSLLFRESHNQPGQYLLKNARTGKTTRIGSVYPQLVDKLKSQLFEGSVVVDGLDIPYLLTLPQKTKQPAPLIVMPHGGPIGVFDQRYFNMTTQYLAAHGYAVLRVNFRGSSGYTEQLKEAGKKQWGKLMLEDIYQATLTASARKDINAEKICVFGMSYGGYAATMLAIKHPDLYQCAINVAGVSDVNLYLNKPAFTKRRDAWALEYIGDTVADYDQLKSISPVYRINELTRPVLIMHGAKDTVVDIEHAYRLKYMLDKYQKPYSWHIFPELKHSFSSSAQAKELFSKVIAFVQEQLK